MTTPTPPELLQQFAVRLYAWTRSFMSRGTVQDVFAWIDRGGANIALYGEAPKLLRAFGGFEKGWNNNGGYLEHSVARALGIQQTLSTSGSWRGVTPQFMNDGSLYAGQFFEGLEGMLGSDEYGFERSNATMIPAPGMPFSIEGQPTQVFSAKNQRVYTVSSLPWTRPIRYRNDEGKDVDGIGADYCKLAVRMPPTGRNVATDLQGIPILVSHTMSFSRSGQPMVGEAHEHEADASAQAVRDCGGLLYPSLAVGFLPASNFGPCTLFFDPSVVLNALKPYRPRTGWPVYVYESDSWTETTRDFIGDYAHNLYLELTGHAQFLYSPWLYVLGPRPEALSFASGHVRRIDTAQQLYRAMAKRIKLWKPSMTYAQFQKVNGKARESFVERYAYAEAKAASIVSTQAITLAASADIFASIFRRWLDTNGYQGPMLSVPTDEATRAVFLGDTSSEQADYLRYTFAWNVTRLVLQR